MQPNEGLLPSVFLISQVTATGFEISVRLRHWPDPCRVILKRVASISIHQSWSSQSSRLSCTKSPHRKNAMPTRATRTSTRREAPATGSDTQQTGPLRRSSKSTASSIVPRQAVIPAQTKPLDADLSPSGQGLEVTTGVDKGQSRTDGRRASPVFEMVVLGSGGGPLETDCSG